MTIDYKVDLSTGMIGNTANIPYLCRCNANIQRLLDQGLDPSTHTASGTPIGDYGFHSYQNSFADLIANADLGQAAEMPELELNFTPEQQERRTGDPLASLSWSRLIQADLAIRGSQKGG